MALDPDIKDRLDEIAEHIRTNSTEIVETRHTLKASMEQIVLQLAENIWAVKGHDKHLDKLDLVIQSNSKEVEGRLRALETIALAMTDAPSRLAAVDTRVTALEKTEASAGKFTWTDVLKAVSALSALTLVVTSIVALAMHYNAS